MIISVINELSAPIDNIFFGGNDIFKTISLCNFFNFPKTIAVDDALSLFFNTFLSDIISLSHPLARLADAINWASFDDGL